MGHIPDPAMREDGLGADGTTMTRLAPIAVQTGTDTRRRWTVAVDGRRLRQARRQHGWSQRTLAEAAGISLATIGRLERQERATCRGRTLARLADALGRQATDLARRGAY